MNRREILKGMAAAGFVATTINTAERPGGPVKPTETERLAPVVTGFDGEINLAHVEDYKITTENNLVRYPTVGSMTEEHIGFGYIDENVHIEFGADPEVINALHDMAFKTEKVRLFHDEIGFDRMGVIQQVEIGHDADRGTFLEADVMLVAS